MTTHPTPPRGTAFDLSDYTYGELKGLLFDVGVAIRERERAEIVRARERIDSISREAGLPLDVLLSGTKIEVRKKP